MTQQPESVDWFAACREASAYAFTLKAELRSVEEKNRLLHQRHHDDNVEYMRVLTQRDALLEALIKCRDRFFPADQPERDRDELWEPVTAAIKAVEGEKE